MIDIKGVKGYNKKKQEENNLCIKMNSLDAKGKIGISRRKYEQRNRRRRKSQQG